MADRADTTLFAKVKRTAVYVKEKIDGVDVFVHRPYDIVEYDYGTGSRDTYLLPHFGKTQSETGVTEVYDDIRVFKTAPDWDLTNSF